MRVVLTELGKLSVELSESFVLIVWGGAKHSVFSECLVDGRASLVELHHKLLSVADTIDVIQSNCSDTLSVGQEAQ